MFDSILRSILISLDKGSFGIKDKILLFKELGHLIKGGVGISESLEIIGDNTDNYAIKELATTLKSQVSQGKSMSSAMLRFPDYFDSADIATIQSGESGGNADSVFSMLGSEYNYLLTLKNKFIGALTYPAILITISFGAIIALFVFVLPAIFEIANELDAAEIPWITMQLKDFSDFLVNNYISLIGGTSFVLFALSVFGSTERGQIVLYTSLYNFPLIGKMIQSYYLIRFARYAKILLGSGMSYRDAFKMLSNVIAIPIFTPLFDKIALGLEHGKTIYDSIKEDTLLIPTSVSALIKVGEKTASLNASFDTIISIYSEELENYIANLSKVIEPIMLIVVGSIIILIALGVFGVIMSIMDGIGM